MSCGTNLNLRIIMKKRIYLDHAATTYVDSRVLRAMQPFFAKNFGNASALYEEGRAAKTALEDSRKKIADLIGTSKEEIIFTSGGTESNNIAILGILNSMSDMRHPTNIKNVTSKEIQKPHIITSNIEHHSVISLIEHLEKNGKIEATYIKVKQNGILDSRDIAANLKENTILVSIMYANNEIGTIQPISEISKIIRNFRNRQFPNSNPIPSTRDSGQFLDKSQNLKTKTDQIKISNSQDLNPFPYFHTDACQAAEYLEMNVQKLGVDLMTVNGSKIYGPKGIGFLYVKKEIEISPITYGGGQELGLRPGTENIASIVGLATAFELANKEKQKESRRLIALRDYFIKKLNEKISNIVLNGDPLKRLPNNINISILGIEGEAAVLYLDAKDVSCATGSACTSESLDPSHVIMALERTYEYANGSLRFSLGKKTTKNELDYVLKVLPPIVEKLRQLSPVNFQELSRKTKLVK